MKILLEVGPPMYLGFLIHVFLHFFILWSNLGKRPIAGREDSLASFSTFERASSIATYVSLEHEGEDSEEEFFNALEHVDDTDNFRS